MPEASWPLLRGTSPRMRGKPLNLFHHSRHTRNIPAYAGKTGLEPRTHWLRSEHPRVCGENAVEKFVDGCGYGTSPRMRGKLSPRADRIPPKRNIPAYAGKTHVVVVAPQVVGGTSPRMRGKLCQASTRYIVTRNIPAYAGKTIVQISAAGDAEEHPRVCGENT